MPKFHPSISFLLGLAAVVQCSVLPESQHQQKPRSTSSHISLVRRHEPGYTHLSRRSSAANQKIVDENKFWFGQFNVGNASNLTLLLDTGSGDVLLNPGLYVPGPASQNTSLAFSNGYATTESDGTGTAIVNGSIFTDTMGFGAFTASQPIGVPSGSGKSPIPGDGIVGFSGEMFKQFPGNTTSFFQSLCDQGQVDECRFGLVLGADGTGTQVLGELDTSLYTGDLTVTQAITGWVVAGDLVVSDTIIARDLVIEMDSGTATVVGPIETISRVFNATGIQGVLSDTVDGPVLTGYFPCDSPPSVGFSIPSLSNASAVAAALGPSAGISITPAIFNIPDGAWIAKDNGDNNCTAVLGGQDYPAFPGLWVVGQPFFQGLYIDHDLTNGTMGFATATSTTNSTSSSNSNSTSPVESENAASGPLLGMKSLAIALLVMTAVLA